ncbi:MAG TPA: hypothetical protein VFC44_09190 [Candidatus Saccharimonadales bacterium]|nr:hypothetical protein [Candidatus Saccharimonadales bacterium]
MTKITEADIFRSKLTPQDLARFLRLHAWKPIPLKHPGLIAFAGSPDQEGKNVEIILPTVGDESSVARNLASALNTLGALLDRPGAELIRLVQCVDRDIFGAKLADPQAQHGTISLERAVKVIGDLRDLFSYAACTEEDPRTAFAKATGIGAKHTKVCRFGHTFAGSFGFMVESPITVSPAPQLVNAAAAGIPVDAAPFERRVMERIMRGIVFTQEAVASGSPEPLIAKYKAGFNANLCETLMELLQTVDEANTEFSVGWSPEWVAPANIPVSVRLEGKAVKYLESAARYLRSPEQSAELIITGLVIALRSKSAPTEVEDDNSPHHVTIEGKENNGAERTVRVSLEPEVYRAACDAHRDGRKVSITGRLEKEGKFWVLMASKDFKVIE